MTLHVWSSDTLPSALRLFVDHASQAIPWPEIAAYVVAVLLAMRFAAVKAWYAARNLRPDRDRLMVVAVLGAMAIRKWFEGTAVVLLDTLCLALESWSVGRARRAIAALLDLAPPTARPLHDDGSKRTVPVGEVRPGNRLLVREGERIALEGRVVAGASAVNQARIIRESIPVEKEDGSEVYAGTEVWDLRAPSNRVWMNGELQQEARVSEVTVGAAELIDLISSVVTLRRGDVIASGTPPRCRAATPGDTGCGIRTAPKIL
jgi:cation transport ATPase